MTLNKFDKWIINKLIRRNEFNYLHNITDIFFMLLVISYYPILNKKLKKLESKEE
jgi:hypothetical protein